MTGTLGDCPAGRGRAGPARRLKIAAHAPQFWRRRYKCLAQSNKSHTVRLIRGDERRLTAVSVGDAVVELPLDPPQRFAPVPGQVE
jgi:hypothetical protein